jgi:hypothetical protein
MPEGRKWCGRFALVVTLGFTLACPKVIGLQASAGQPDLSNISSANRDMIESACSGDRILNGPAAYYSCLRREVNALQASQGDPDLTTIPRAERSMIESACSGDRILQGPAAYYNCVRRQLAALASNQPPKAVAQPAEAGSTSPSEVPKLSGQDGSTSPAEEPRVADKIAATLKEDETWFCQHSREPECHEAFLRSIQYRSVTLTPTGQNGLIVEVSAQGFCGSGGCAIYVLKKAGSRYSTVLSDLGGLDSLQVTTSATDGYY